MTQPLTHARIGYDSITQRATITASAELTGYPASSAVNQLTYAFWSAGLPSWWAAELSEAEACNYFGIAAHTLWSNHVMVVMQAWINAAWRTMPVITTAGDLWRFDDDFYGERGGAPGATIGALRRGTAVDGLPVHPFFNDTPDYQGARESRFGSHALTVEPGIINLFPENVRNCGDTNEDLTGFDSGSDASYTKDRSVSGAGCMLVESGGGGAVLKTDPVGISATTNYTVQCKILCPIDNAVELTLTGDVSGLLGTVEFSSSPPGSWNLIWVTLQTGGSDTTIYAEVVIDSESCYVDELQLEIGAAAHTWADGTRAAGNLAYQPEIIQQISNAMTINLWARMPAANEASIRILVACGDTGGTQNRCRIQRNASATNLVVSTSDADAVFDNLTATLAWDDSWHMVTVVIESSSSLNKKIYVDGKLANEVTTTSIPTWADVDIFHVGHASQSNRIGASSAGLIDDLLVLNRAATPDEIKTWHDNGEATDLATVGLPAYSDDRPIMTLVEENTSNKFRLRFVGQSTPVVGVIYMGKALEIERPLYGGHSPINLSRVTVTRPNISERGQWLGRTIIRSGAGGSWTWSNLTAAWVRRYLDPFVEAARTTPFFVLWRPAKFPGESAYCWTMRDLVPANSGPRDLMSFTLDAEGLGHE